MATTLGNTFHYAPPDGLGAVGPRVQRLRGGAFCDAEKLHAQLQQLGIGPTTRVTDLGDELVGQHQVKLMGWIDDDGLPRVTSIRLQQFCENFRRAI